MKRGRKAMIILVVAVFSLFLFRFVSPVRAFDQRSGNEVIIAQGEVVEDDLYASANLVRVDGVIKGDLVATGNVIVLGPSGVVEGDLLAAGQGVTINGKVMDDARIAGMSLALGEQAQIADDLVAAGFSLRAAQGSRVGGDLAVGAYQAILDSSIEGNVLVGSNALEIGGEIAGNVDANVGSKEDGMPFSPFAFMPQTPGVPPVSLAQGGLVVGPNARIGGNLNYEAPAEASLPQGVVAGAVNFKQYVPQPGQAEAPPPPPTAGQQAFEWFVKFLRLLANLLILAFLFTWLFPKLISYTGEVLQATTWRSLLWGVAAYIAFFLAVLLVSVFAVILVFFLFLFTLGDLAWFVIGLATVLILGLSLVFKLAVSYLARIIVAYLLGRLILARLKPDAAGSPFWPVVLGLFLVVLLVSIPVVGWLINLLVVLFGLGALWQVGMESWKARMDRRSLAV